MKRNCNVRALQLALNFNIDLPDRSIRRLTNEELYSRTLRTTNTKQRAIDSKIELPEWVFRLALKQLNDELYRRRR